MTSRLSAILSEGDVIQYKYAGKIFRAYYEGGVLVDANDSNLTYNTPSGFASRYAPYGINGWKECEILYEGDWIPLNSLEDGGKRRYA